MHNHPGIIRHVYEVEHDQKNHCGQDYGRVEHTTVGRLRNSRAHLGRHICTEAIGWTRQLSFIWCADALIPILLSTIVYRLATGSRLHPGCKPGIPQKAAEGESSRCHHSATFAKRPQFLQGPIGDVLTTPVRIFWCAYIFSVKVAIENSSQGLAHMHPLRKKLTPIDPKGTLI